MSTTPPPVQPTPTPPPVQPTPTPPPVQPTPTPPPVQPTPTSPPVQPTPTPPPVQPTPTSPPVQPTPTPPPVQPTPTPPPVQPTPTPPPVQPTPTPPPVQPTPTSPPVQPTPTPPPVQPTPTSPPVQPTPTPPPVQPTPTPPPVQPTPTPAPGVQGAQPTLYKPKILVLCFDGTGNKFGKNSNVVRFMHALEKQDPDAQVVYYQPGIGTYFRYQFIFSFFSKMWAAIETAFARGLPNHVKDGYKFLMQYYRPGDKICLFGFSRGAYTARALAGMLYKVGLLLPGNDQQLDFAYQVYSQIDREGATVARQFKETFSNPVKIHFLGVWDTVASVGLVPRSLPYSTQNDGVNYFRHALALDERRTRFRPNLWGEPITTREEIDTIGELVDKNKVSRDFWVYKPPSVVDVKEVWFAGAHADVGGGSHEASRPTSLSRIPLRWMIRECFITKTGILFDKERLRANAEMDLGQLKETPRSVPIDKATVATTKWATLLPKVKLPVGLTDVVERIYDQLDQVQFWWILEWLPLLAISQKSDGSWARWRRRNYGYGRLIPDTGHEIFVHKSVRTRIENKPLNYKPAAINWDQLPEDKRQYID